MSALLYHQLIITDTSYIYKYYEITQLCIG